MRFGDCDLLLFLCPFAQRGAPTLEPTLQIVSLSSNGVIYLNPCSRLVVRAQMPFNARHLNVIKIYSEIQLFGILLLVIVLQTDEKRLESQSVKADFYGGCQLFLALSVAPVAVYMLRVSARDLKESATDDTEAIRPRRCCSCYCCARSSIKVVQDGDDEPKQEKVVSAVDERAKRIQKLKDKVKLLALATKRMKVKPLSVPEISPPSATANTDSDADRLVDEFVSAEAKADDSAEARPAENVSI